MFDALTPEKYLADLHWTVTSPSLLQTQAPLQSPSQMPVTSYQPPKALVDWLQQVEATALAHHIQAINPRRLGHYFEALWQYVFQYYPGYELLTHNLQVINGPRTQGEYDLIYYCHERQQTIHLEMAIKFYLGTTTLPLAQCWLGPGCLDRLDIKLDKLLQQQICLADSPSGQQALAALTNKGEEHNGEGQAVQREVLVKGCLFQPDIALALPAVINPAHQSGLWLHLSEFAQRFTDSNYVWCRLQKAEWLAPWQTDLNHYPVETTAQVVAAINTHFAQHSFPVMAWQLADNKQDVAAQQRVFIVPDHWPATD